MKQGTQESTSPPDNMRVNIIVPFTLERKGRLKELSQLAWGHSWLLAVPGFKPESLWLQSLWALVTISIPRGHLISLVWLSSSNELTTPSCLILSIATTHTH